MPGVEPVMATVAGCPVMAMIDIAGLRIALGSVSIPRAADGRLVLAVDVTSWLRPEAHIGRQRILCHTDGRGKRQQ